LFAICSAEVNVVEAEEQGGCSVCQLVVSYVESYIAQNATEAEIIKALDSLCANLPIFGQQCDAIVAQYTPQIIQWIINKEPPQAFCASVGLCPNKKEKVTGAIPCSICQIATTYVEKWVAENATEQAIIQRLDAFCTVVGPLAPQCDSFVAIYVPKLIEWVVTKENPQAFCAQVGLCPSKKFVMQSSRQKREEFELEEDEEDENEEDVFLGFEDEQSAGCQVCELVVTYVEQLVANNNTIQQIEAKVEQLCDYLGPLSGECDQVVVQYLPALVTWILKKENPKAFCSQVGLC